MGFNIVADITTSLTLGTVQPANDSTMRDDTQFYARSQDMHPIVLGLRYFFGHLKNFFKKFLTNRTVCTQCRQTAEVFIVLSPVAERKGDVRLFRAEEYVHNWTNAILFKESIKNARQAVSSYPHDNLLQSFNKNIEGVFDAPMPSEGRRPLKKNRERPM
jgi:hypothetical protein